jgi:hypothetical protein
MVNAFTEYFNMLDLSSIQSVNSWDCFDTLVARRKRHPHSVFDSLSKTLNWTSFKADRIQAEIKASKTLKDIYEELCAARGYSKDTAHLLMELEIQAEIEECIPIIENIKKVQDGDLIISDMYLPAEAILRILKKCGLVADVKILVSSNGKSSGAVWPEVKHVKLHTGDNWHSDVAMPTQFNIPTSHYTESWSFTGYEEIIGGDLALLMRALRLMNPYSRNTEHHRLWYEQAQLNIPALILISLELPEKNLAFVHRDCVHLQPIYETIYKVKATEFHCSRYALNNSNPAWDNYVKATAYGKTIVDLQGSGKSMITYWQKTFNQKPSLLYATGKMAEGEAIIPVVRDVMERFNSSRLGSLLEWPNRDICEHREDYLETQHTAVKKALELIPCFSFKKDKFKLGQLITLMLRAQTPSIVSHYHLHGNQKGTVKWPGHYTLDDQKALDLVTLNY